MATGSSGKSKNNFDCDSKSHATNNRPSKKIETTIRHDGEMKNGRPNGVRGENGRRMTDKGSNNNHAGFNSPWRVGCAGWVPSWASRGKMVAFITNITSDEKIIIK